MPFGSRVGNRVGRKSRGRKASEQVLMGWSRLEEVMLETTSLVDLVRNGPILYALSWWIVKISL